jgi:hypothetical protein
MCEAENSMDDSNLLDSEFDPLNWNIFMSLIQIFFFSFTTLSRPAYVCVCSHGLLPSGLPAFLLGDLKKGDH